MSGTITLMHDQEVRRQAMLQAMQLDVWLPRQTLNNGAASRDYLLQWQAQDTAVALATQSIVAAQPSASQTAGPAAQTHVPAARTGAQAYVSVRDRLASLQAIKPATTAVRAVVETAVARTDTTQVVEPVAAQAEPIPRFALQLLRADNCLVLVDLPTGEPFQSRDPDYQLLKDMLRAAGLTDKPSMMRQGVPITWPMLLAGNLMHEQHAAAARACVRDLLSFELHSAPAACIWLVGRAAVRFGNADDNTPLYTMQTFDDGVQLWSLPSLERVLEQPLLKREIWRSMCALGSLWQVHDDA